MFVCVALRDREKRRREKKGESKIRMKTNKYLRVRVKTLRGWLHVTRHTTRLHSGLAALRGSAISGQTVTSAVKTIRSVHIMRGGPPAVSLQETNVTKTGKYLKQPNNL